MAKGASSTDAAEATKPGGARKRWSPEKPPDFVGGREEHGLGLGTVRESATGGLAATWNASQASLERGAAMLPGWLRRLGYYGLALLFVAVAATLRWEMRDILSPTPFLVFYLAWVGAAVFGGLGPGLLATVASWVCVDLLFDTTPGQVDLIDPASIGRLMVLLAGGLAVSVVGEKMRRSRIHERRQGRKLAELAQLANLAPLLILDSRDRIISWSDGCARLYGFTAEQVVGRVSHELLKTEFPQPLEAIQAILHGTGRWEGELTHRRADGTVVNVASLWVLRDGAPNPVVLEVNNDITGRKRAEEALRESEEKYRRIVETATEGIVMVDANARTVFVNDRWSEIFGYSLEEAMHMTHFDLVFPEDMAQMSERWESRKRGRKESYEFRFRRKDGSLVWLLIGVAPRLDPEGGFLGTLVMVTDITQRKEAEEALRELNATLESRVAQRTGELEHRAGQLQKLTLDLTEAENRERKRLAAILHDDLQQVLAAAKFHLGLVSNQCKNDEALQEMTRQVKELLVEAIGKSRSLSHELSPPGLAHSDLRETFEWLAGQMQAKHGLRVHAEVCDGIELQSEPIKALLYKAAQEMPFNVIKHAHVREARLRLRRRRGNICLAVSDKGRGFDPQGLGTAAGFGLLSIRERVNLLGGRMKVRSAEGKGSTFLIAIPDLPRRTHTPA